MIDEERIHDILTRIHDGELIGRCEGKTSALLHFATNILLTHHDVNIAYNHMGPVSYVRELLQRIAEECFGVQIHSMKNTDNRFFKVGESYIHFHKFKQVRNPIRCPDIEIYDIPNEERESTIIKIDNSPKLDEVYEYKWLNPKITPDYSRYIQPEKRNMKIDNAINNWGTLNV